MNYSHLIPGQLNSLYGMDVLLSELVTEPAEKEVPASFFERWIEPLFIKPATKPFEPWVKTKTIIVEVPAKKALVTPYGLVMHPEMFEDMKATLAEQGGI